MQSVEEYEEKRAYAMKFREALNTLQKVAAQGVWSAELSAKVSVAFDLLGIAATAADWASGRDPRIESDGFSSMDF